MIIPRYWAEAKAVTKVNGHNQTYRRFGWSDLNEAEAAAQKRVDEAVALAQKGENVRRIDHKVAYNGAEGLPIREEIIKTFNETILSRNSYGALCLNTPNVVFADVDVDNQYHSKLFLTYGVLIFGAIFSGIAYGPTSIVTLGCVALLITLCVLELLYKYLLSRWLPTPEERALKKIRKFSIDNRDWRLRIYRTPQGYRVMVMHECFNADSPQVHSFFKAIGTDPYYMQMCHNQKCFRARVSPKPWRINMERIASGSGVWPVKTDKLFAREKWVRRYEYESRKFSSCVYLESLGSNSLDPHVERVRAIHDKYCQAGRQLPLA